MLPMRFFRCSLQVKLVAQFFNSMPVFEAHCAITRVIDHDFHLHDTCAYGTVRVEGHGERVVLQFIFASFDFIPRFFSER